MSMIYVSKERKKESLITFGLVFSLRSLLIVVFFGLASAFRAAADGLAVLQRVPPVSHH